MSDLLYLWPVIKCGLSLFGIAVFWEFAMYALESTTIPHQKRTPDTPPQFQETLQGPPPFTPNPHPEDYGYIAEGMEGWKILIWDVEESCFRSPRGDLWHEGILFADKVPQRSSDHGIYIYRTYNQAWQAMKYGRFEHPNIFICHIGMYEPVDCYSRIHLANGAFIKEVCYV